MPVDTPDDESISSFLDELEDRARQRYDAERRKDHWVCHRRYPRHPFRAPCVARFLCKGSLDVTELPGRTRNLSRSGVGVLVRQVLAIGEALEVEVQAPNRLTMYVAGLVIFCRYAGRGYHEVGMSLKVAQSKPVFSNSPLTAMQSLDWLHPEPETA